METETEQKTLASTSTTTSSQPSQSQDTSEHVMTSMSIPQRPGSPNEGATDALLCVICTETVADDDVCWVEMHCGQHSHLYHVDCIALWWFERDHRNCPRCTQSGQPFSVHARSLGGLVASRTFATRKQSDTSMLHGLTLVGQSHRFAQTVQPPFPTSRNQAGWESVGSQVDIWAALVDWPQQMWVNRRGKMAEAGLERARAVSLGWEKYWKRLEESVEREEQWQEQEQEVAGVNIGYGVLPGETS